MMYLTMTGSLVQMPRLRKWLLSLSESEVKSICKNVESVIKDVFYKVATFDGKPIKPSIRSKTGSIYSFSAAIYGNGTFHLTTLGEYSALATGDCMPAGALFFRSPGTSQKDAWENPSLPIEYGLHNADRDNGEAKRLSLYAGAGTIAWLAKNGIR